MNDYTLKDQGTVDEAEPVRLLTEEQVAEFWGVTTSLLQKMRHEGKGPRFVRIGRLVRYRTSDLACYLEEHSVGTKQQPTPTVPAVH